MTPPTQATWSKLAEHDVLKRSSHAVAAIGGEVFVFGGEVVPRVPRDGDVHALAAGKDTKTQPRTLTSPSKDGPTPRVGASMVALQETLYIFSGRGGTAMSALSENGSFWKFTPSNSTWSLLSPADASAPYPEARSYHSATTDGDRRIYIHAGCPASGRLRDFWCFDVEARGWTRLADAPGKERGGTSLAFAQGRVWRFGGFDGEREVGGLIDWFDVGKGTWESVEFGADGVKGPGARSVAALVPLVIKGRQVLVSVFGEADPSSLGHAGAGKMLGDSWVFDIEGQVWARLEPTDTGDGVPASRGWFAAASVGEGRLVFVGGLGEDNERIGDAWALEFEG